MSSDSERQEVVDLLRSCLLSSQGGLTLEQIDHDYRELVGEGIPYRKLGHVSLSDFFSKARDVCRLMEVQGKIIVHPVATEATQHIDSLVTHQKKAPRGAKKRTSIHHHQQHQHQQHQQHHNQQHQQHQRRPQYNGNNTSTNTNTNKSTPPSHWNPGYSPNPPPNSYPPVTLGGKGGKRPSNTRKVGSGRLPPRSSIAGSTTNASSASSASPASNASPGSPASNASYPTYRQQPKLRSPSANTLLGSHPSSTAKTKSNGCPSLPLAKRNGSFHQTSNGSESSGNSTSNSNMTPTPSAPQNTNYPQQQLKIGTFHSGKQPHSHPSRGKSHRYPASSSSSSSCVPPTPERCYLNDLTMYFKDKDLGVPEFKTSEMGSKKMRHRTYVSSVTVEGQSFRTFPVEFSSKELAEEAAARLAVEALGLKVERSATTNMEEDAFQMAGEMTTLVADRIVEIVGDKWNGTWSTQVDLEYKAKYKEVLPPDWPLLIIPDKHRLRINVPIEDHYIVFPIKNESLDEEEEPMEESGKGKGKPTNDPSLCTTHVNESTLPPIDLNSEDNWEVHVMSVSSPFELVVRILNNCQYDDLTTDMELYYYDYYSELPPISEPLVGCLYAAKLDSDWHRVRVTNVHGIEVTCYFLDLGDEELLGVQDLRAIQPKFLKFPPQALTVRLDKLEHLASDDEVATELLRKNVLRRSFVAEVVSREKVPRLTLFDTSADEDVNVNKKVLEQVKEGNGLVAACLSQGEVISPAFLLSVSSSGDCIVRKGEPSASSSSLENLTQEEKDELWGEAAPPTSLDANKLYLARNVLSNHLYRVSPLTTEIKEGKVEITSLDTGNQETLDLNDLREIGSNSKLLSQLLLCEKEKPNQEEAFKCCLANIPKNFQWTREAADKLRCLIPEEKKMSLKVLTVSSGEHLPLVEMHLHDKSNKEATDDPDSSSSVNAIISQMKDLFLLKDKSSLLATNSNHDEAGENTPLDSEMKTSLSPQDELLFSEVASLKGLVYPKIPEKDEYFDVTVTLAANPSYFYVQPWRETESLEVLTSEINEYYSTPSRRVGPVTMEDLRKDSYFAALHNDGFWYRIKVDRVLDDENISVKLVDYGDCAMIDVKNLQPLWPQFRNLPMQAIKACLSDIVPVNGDWTPDDALWFSKRSVEKQFVSIVKDISHEEDGSMKLGISLVDVSHPNEDILIDKLLVEANKAVYLCI